MKNLTPFINPIEWVRAWKFKKQSRRYDKSSFDLELHLYSRILNSRMLHYGYFDDPEIKAEEISIGLLESAQVRYADNIIEFVKDTEGAILDVGCGMGGLADMIHARGLEVEVLTPDKNQIAFIAKNYPHLKSHNVKYEKLDSERKYGAIINSESLQYIRLADAFRKSSELLAPGGRWIIVDYFRLNDTGVSKSSHLLENFRLEVEAGGWKVEYEKDITANILPTLKLIHMYVDRILLPLKHYGYEKLRFKKPGLYYLSGRVRDSIDRKFDREAAASDPARFLSEKRYMFFVLAKI